MKLKDFYLEKVFPGLKAEKAQAFSTVALTLIAAAFFGLFAINPTITTIIDLRKQLSDNQTADQQLQQKISGLSSLDQQYATLESKLPLIYSAIPVTPNTALLLAEIQTVASQNHINLIQTQTTNITIPPVQPQQQNIYSFAVSINGEGNLTDLENFANQLIKIDRILTIDEIAIQQPLKNSTKTNPTITINGKAFYNKQ